MVQPNKLNDHIWSWNPKCLSYCAVSCDWQNNRRDKPPNDEYENFVTTPLQAATDYIPTKPKAKSKISKAIGITRKKKQLYLKEKIQQTQMCRNSRKFRKNLLKLAKNNNRNTFKVKSIKSEILQKINNLNLHGRQ